MFYINNLNIKLYEEFMRMPILYHTYWITGHQKHIITYLMTCIWQHFYSHPIVCKACMQYRLDQNRRSTQPKKHNRCHAMTHNDSSSKCSRHVRSQCSYERHSPPWMSAMFNIFRGWMPLISTLARTMATALKQLCQNHRQNQ